MNPAPTSDDETRFDLCVRGEGTFLKKRVETELVLSHEGISYALDGRSGLRPYAGLKGIRLQLLSPKPWIALAQLDFVSGHPLFVYSHLPEDGTSPERDRAFAGFVVNLHRHLTPEDRARIAFRRGISPIRHKAVMACAAGFAAPGLFILLGVLDGRVPAAEAAWPIIGFGVFAVGIANMARTTWPGSYDPEHLPSDLVPGA
jgi:hypothetical protein